MLCGSTKKIHFKRESQLIPALGGTKSTKPQAPLQVAISLIALHSLMGASVFIGLSWMGFATWQSFFRLCHQRSMGNHIRCLFGSGCHNMDKISGSFMIYHTDVNLSSGCHLMYHKGHPLESCDDVHHESTRRSAASPNR